MELRLLRHLFTYLITGKMKGAVELRLLRPLFTYLITGKMKGGAKIAQTIVYISYNG